MGTRIKGKSESDVNDEIEDSKIKKCQIQSKCMSCIVVL